MVSSQQTPIPSGFGPQTTASDVLQGYDLTGRTALVTGGHSGLGLETTRALARAGAHVMVAARHPETARVALEGLSSVEVCALDLADLRSVRVFAQSFLTRGQHLDMLIGSAGIMACPETRVGPGWEAQFATNHLGHYALVNQLWPALKGSARVVMVSSAGHRLSAMRWDDVQWTQGYDKWLAYGQSKTANALFAVELDRLAQGQGVRAFSVHPGKIMTPLQRHLTREEMMAAGWVDAQGHPLDPTFKRPEQGAATQVWAATSPQLAGRGGVYCEDVDIAVINDGSLPGGMGVQPYAIDVGQAERLWQLSADLTGVNAFARP